MKIRYEEKQETTDKLVKDIPVGTIFSGSIGSIGYNNGIYLKTYDAIVDLEQPRYTWPLPPEEFDGKPSPVGVSAICNYKELSAEVVINED